MSWKAFIIIITVIFIYFYFYLITNLFNDFFILIFLFIMCRCGLSWMGHLLVLNPEH